MKIATFFNLSRFAAVFLTPFLTLFLNVGSARAEYANYAERADVAAFIQEIAARNGLDPAALTTALSRANYNPRVIDLIKPPETRIVRSWSRYRGRFLDRLHINAGINAWAQYESTLRRAEKEYGVPPEVILGILGVETIYGRNTGNFETLSALATLAFDYPPRAELFQGELEALFLLARDQHRDPASYTGSFAGAIGWPQFLPSSIRRYAVDFNGDGRIDFDSDAEDAIGSIANYLREWGWTANTPVAIKVRVPPDTDPAPLIDAGIEPSLSPARIAEAGLRPFAGNLPAADATLVDLETPGLDTEYWLGYRNFYVITRYNRSSFYAMAVFELSRALRAEYDAPGSASHMVAKPIVMKSTKAATRKAATRKRNTTRVKKPGRRAR
ncbi:MAG: lytic murein transglycosylase B [Azoarcus sp.]|jgi:membrane-bound lytic murein transglycosylase B|nr:lytic murein transglycosylase B [Azoarcus sp.]